ncbi:sensor domain-containing diguanylate cyclase [Pseudomonas sp. BN411]|uniref:sensor domain-containing diguanylate cyclase n=1 Tax=Pseudomonas sp. BN411 TaxID=2567887 RepID=UPI002456703B|nr:sensor domain-containing diguanylate cyclase [Pseudomonas sp. BN411]MDH4562907.1 sensor domain-containing diguanylate cyclase [Pseudomonas sp. BN411]
METLYFSPMLLGLNLMLASAVACTGLWYFSRPYRGPGFWMAGAWTLILGILLFMGFMASGNPVLNVLGNATQLAGEAILLLGVFRFLGRRPPYWTVPASAGAMALVNSWHWFSAINSELLIAIYAAIGGALPLQACYVLLAERREPALRSARLFVGLTLLGYALVTLLRAGIGVHDWLQQVEHPDVTRSLSYLLPYNFGIPLWVIALVGLALMTMRRILEDSQRHAREAEASAHRFERLMGVANAGMLVVDDGRILDANPMLEQLFALRREQLLGQPLARLVTEAEAPRLAELLLQADGRPHDIDACRGDGNGFPAELAIASLDNSHQRLVEIRDVSHRKALEQQLLHLATTDPLTGALNRRAFEERAEQELQRARRQHSPLCLALLDLDHFKQINDRHGHQVGDEVLRQFSQLCQRQARRTDLFARYGGEEFIFLLPDTNADAAHHLLERLRLALQGLEIVTADGNLRVSVSIGLASVSANDDLHRLQGVADAALYRAKQLGRNRIELAL